jgi:hypothetical protein
MKKRIKAEEKEKLKAEKEAARLKKEAAERAAREAADVVSPPLAWLGRQSAVLSFSMCRITRRRTMACCRSTCRKRGPVRLLTVSLGGGRELTRRLCNSYPANSIWRH